jgi:hypothetical protein
MWGQEQSATALELPVLAVATITTVVAGLPAPGSAPDLDDDRLATGGVDGADPSVAANHQWDAQGVQRTHRLEGRTAGQLH